MTDADLFVQYVSLGFVASLVVYINGQAVRIMWEIIEEFTKRYRRRSGILGHEVANRSYKAG